MRKTLKKQKEKSLSDRKECYESNVKMKKSTCCMNIQNKIMIKGEKKEKKEQENKNRTNKLITKTKG